MRLESVCTIQDSASNAARLESGKLALCAAAVMRSTSLEGRSLREHFGLHPTRREFCRRLADRQQIAFHQRPAGESADAAGEMGRTAAQDFRHLNAAPDAQVAARSGPCSAEPERLSGGGLEGRPQGDRDAIERGRKIGARQRQPGVAAEEKASAQQRHFQSGGPIRIADHPVADAQRHGIGRAAGRYAKLAEAPPAEVLHAGLHARSLHFDQGHARASSSKRRWSMIVKRTSSPGRSRLIGSRAGSNSRSGVRPTSRHPPGVSAG